MQDIEAIILSCGHSINTYKSLGVCQRCKKKSCEKCLTVLDDQLLCPSCFCEVVKNGKSD